MNLVKRRVDAIGNQINDEDSFKMQIKKNDEINEFREERIYGN